MSGRFLPIIKFPFYIEECKDSRIQLEPILSSSGYGICVKMILTLTKGVDANKYEYERVIFADTIFQMELPDGDFYETFFEFFEGLYYNKISQDVAVPLAAMMLKMHFKEMVDNVGLDLSEYYVDMHHLQKKQLGYHSRGI